jgi:hypothetical protein
MNRIAIFAVVFLSFKIALSQSDPTSDSFINSRQVEVERLAETLYSTRLDSSRWVRHDVKSCGGFTHHSFALFDDKSAKDARFVAIYDLDHAAARSTEKPWEGGIKLLPLRPRSGLQLDGDLASEALLSAFNRAVTMENAVHRSKMDPVDETICLISLSGEEPAITSTQEAHAEAHSKPPVKIASLLLPLAGGPGVTPMASLEFGPNGEISKAKITEQHKP